MGHIAQNFARPELDRLRLGDVVDLFINLKMTGHGDRKDIERLTSELSGLFTKSHELEEEIRKRLGEIGYDI